MRRVLEWFRTGGTSAASHRAGCVVLVARPRVLRRRSTSVHGRSRRGGRVDRTPVNDATASAADERERLFGHDHVIGGPEQQRRAGDAWADDNRTVGTALDVPDLARPRSPACSAVTPSATLAPEDGDPPDQRDPELDGEADCAVDRVSFGGADRTTVLAAVEAEAARRSAVELREPRIAALLRCPKMGVDAAGSVNRRGITPPPRASGIALWPPNPNEFDSTGPEPTACGPRTRCRGRCRRRLLEVGGRRNDAVAERAATRRPLRPRRRRRSCAR